MDWRPISTARPDGTVSRIRCRDPLGYYALPFDCFLHDNGQWYRIDPPRQLSAQPTHWMPSQEMTPPPAPEGESNGRG